jgi:hypothetical protein
MLVTFLEYLNVPQKHLTVNTYWGTLNEVGRMQMANALNTDKQIAIIAVRVAIMQELKELRANADIEAEAE